MARRAPHGRQNTQHPPGGCIRRMPRLCGAGVVVHAVLAALISTVLLPAPSGAAPFDNTNVAVWELTGNPLVRDLASDGVRVFVGGSFDGLRDGAGGTEVPQPWLAALDEPTGAHDPTFAPALDGEVWGVEVSDDGSMLYVAGAFNNVNGSPRTGIVALDPVTGATLPGFSTVANNEVLDIALEGDELYLVGRFNAINGAQREKIARVDTTTGALDAGWAPFANAGNANSIAVDPLLDRVYVGGFFSDINGAPNSEFLAAVSRSSGTVVAGFDPLPEGGVYDLLARPGRLYAATGGPGGFVEILDTVTGGRIVSLDGDGDLQALAASGPDIYAGGHHETGLGGGPSSPVARLDGGTDIVDATFGPDITSLEGFGVWAVLATDTDLWVGGAITAAAPVKAVGVARYPSTSTDPVDTTAPTDPTALTVDGVSDITVRLSWTPGTDASGVVDHIIERDGVALGAVRGSTFIDANVVPNSSYDYVVRAVDLSGNVSVDSATVTGTTLALSTEITAVPFGAMWSYLDSGPAPDQTWRDVGFDDSAWPTGVAELGQGDGDEDTVITNRAVNYLRQSVTLSPDQAVGAATLRYLRDDGVVVSVNGTEVARDNVPAGPVGHDTNALSFIFGPQESELITVELDPSLFGVGDNVVAVSLHNAAGSGDSSFDAELRLRVGSMGADTTPPSTPAAFNVDGVSEGSVQLSWQASSDNVAVTGYEVRRDGTPVGTTSATTFSDGGLTPETTYSYSVVAIDAAGNTSAEAGSLQATTTAVPLGSIVLVGPGTNWAIDDSGTTPPADWNTSPTAPATWSPGTTEIGVGDGGEATLVTPRPVMFVRTSFDVGDPSAIGALTLDLLADDGAVAYVNGVEVVRDNVGPGSVDSITPAATYRWTVQDETVPISWQVPTGVLTSGPNILAVSVHNAPGSSDTSFDATLTASYQSGPDTDPPTAPVGLTVAGVTSASADLDWSPAFDNVAVAGYRVFRDGVEVADTAATAYDDGGLAPATSYDWTVVAYDGAGNIGPAAGPVSAQTLGDVLDLVTADAEWRYLDTGLDPGSSWPDLGFDDNGWLSGAAELGVGDGGEATVIGARPVVWFRTTFEVTDPASLIRADVHVQADDGAAIYLNGAEVARDNLPAGPLTATTPALSYRWTAADEAAFRTFSLPVSGLQAGTNVLAVRVHNGQGSGDMSFAARVEVQQASSPDVTPPTAPGTPVLDAMTDSTASISWAPASDDVAVDRYEVLRDGAVVGSSFLASFVDGGLAPLTAYQYTVRAVDTAGNVGPTSGILDVTTEDLPDVPDVMVDLGATWRYLDDGAAFPVDWTLTSFDDSGWFTGPAELGAADGDEATVITNQPAVLFRHTFDVADPASYTSLVVEVVADDGAVVHLNGTEVVRDNVDPGPVDETTAAAGYRFGSAERALRSFVLDPAQLVAGDNVIAISIHNGPGSVDMSFAAILTAD